ncbi:MAG: ABC transporter ATP-binding protein [Tepidiformaceae bacterium]
MRVELSGVTFRRGRREVLNIPSLAFASGAVTALLGPNGSGKSTLLRLVGALERPATGSLTIDGRPVGRDRPTHAAIAFAFQGAVFVSGSVRSNMDLALRLRGLQPRERSQRIEEAAAACGIIHLLDRDANRLSGGEAQRANLARTLGLRAPLTLLDEPLAGLDGLVRRQLLMELPALLTRFATTTVIVTHDRDEALRLADDIVLLMDGRVHASGPKRDVFSRPASVEAAAFLGYTIVPGAQGDDSVLAIAPGELREGPGEVTFELLVSAVADLGSRHEALGTIGAAAAAVTLTGTAPQPGCRMLVSAPESAVLRFPSGTA